jgi:hypothetical protein
MFTVDWRGGTAPYTFHWNQLFTASGAPASATSTVDASEATFKLVVGDSYEFTKLVIAITDAKGQTIVRPVTYNRNYLQYLN